MKAGGRKVWWYASRTPDLLELVVGRSYYPEYERKPLSERITDNIKLIFKDHCLERFYLLYGLDIKGADMDAYINYWTLAAERDAGNRRHEESSQIALLRDKYLFYLYMSRFGLPVPKVFAMISNGQVLDAGLNEMTMDDLKERKDYFLKSIDGEAGEFVKHIDTFDNLKAMYDEGTLKKGRYILQERIIQNELMNAIYPESINTYRIITIMKNGKPMYFSSACRIGTSISGHIDNWAAGGIAVGIDRETGHFKQWAFFKPSHGRKVDVHPDTGVRFAECKAPYFEEAVELCLKAHSYFYGVQSIGWDVAISKDGPCFIEGNDNFGIGFMQSCDRPLSKDWEEAIKG